MCVGHPHKVRVAGQQRGMRRVFGVVKVAEITVGQQNVDYQLQVGLPSNRIPKQNHSCMWN